MPRGKKSASLKAADGPRYPSLGEKFAGELLDFCEGHVKVRLEEHIAPLQEKFDAAARDLESLDKQIVSLKSEADVRNAELETVTQSREEVKKQAEKEKKRADDAIEREAKKEEENTKLKTEVERLLVIVSERDEQMNKYHKQYDEMHTKYEQARKWLEAERKKTRELEEERERLKQTTVVRREGERDHGDLSNPSPSADVSELQADLVKARAVNEQLVNLLHAAATLNDEKKELEMEVQHLKLRVDTLQELKDTAEAELLVKRERVRMLEGSLGDSGKKPISSKKDDVDGAEKNPETERRISVDRSPHKDSKPRRRRGSRRSSVVSNPKEEKEKVRDPRSMEEEKDSSTSSKRLIEEDISPSLSPESEEEEDLSFMSQCRKKKKKNPMDLDSLLSEREGDRKKQKVGDNVTSSSSNNSLRSSTSRSLSNGKEVVGEGDEDLQQDEEDEDGKGEERKEPTAPRELIPLDRILWKPFFMEDETDETCYYVVQNEDGQTYQWMSHDQLDLSSPLPLRIQNKSSIVEDPSLPVSKGDLAKAKSWKTCSCKKAKACQPLYQANRLDLRVASQCSDEACRKCGATRFVHLKDISMHGHLKLNTHGKVVSNVCIPKDHFIACVTGVVVEGDMEERDTDTMAVPYRVREQLGGVNMCEETKSWFHFLKEDSLDTVGDWIRYSKAHNAVLDENGYIWAVKKIRSGEQLNVSMDLASLVANFKRYKKHLRPFEAELFLESFGDHEKGLNYSIMDYIVDNVDKFPLGEIEEYIPKLADSEIFLDALNARNG